MSTVLITQSWVAGQPQRDLGVDSAPRALSAFVQNALRGGLEYDTCERSGHGAEASVTLTFWEDTGLRRIPHQVLCEWQPAAEWEGWIALGH